MSRSKIRRQFGGRFWADLTDVNAVAAICKKYSPDIVIHCAGIAHQKIGFIQTISKLRE